MVFTGTLPQMLHPFFRNIFDGKIDGHLAALWFYFGTITAPLEFSRNASFERGHVF